MTNKEIKNYVEEQISYHCDEFGLVREEVEDVVLLNCIEHFYRDLISEEDLLGCANYLDMEIDIETIKRLKGHSQRTQSKKKGAYIEKELKRYKHERETN